MILYGLEGSGNSYKARLMLEFLGLAYEKREPAVHPADEEFLRLNPLGQVPVLIDKNDTGTSSLPLPDGRVLRDSNAILVYLALKYDPSSSWYPVADPATASRIAQWMSYATHEVTDSLLWVRIKNKFSWEIPVTYDEALDRSRKVLSFINGQLLETFPGDKWIATKEHPSIADIALFPYVAFAETSSSGALSLANYPAVVAWIERLKSLPNFSPMPPF
jgi:glutathione S-transferase